MINNLQSETSRERPLCSADTNGSAGKGAYRYQG